MSFAIGESVGPYRILGQLGQGGMATVFKAYHAALDRYVAIKALHPAFMEEPNFLARFRREARVVANLEHPNIVPIYDFSEHAGRPYLVMKFIEGLTLKGRLKDGPLSRDEILAIVEAVGSALSYAHRHGVLHRDVKPSNVLLSPDGPIYLADFGLARIAESGESTLSNDMMMGTPQYISPEQAKGEGTLDEGTDIYSLGVVIYEMVVGHVPFSSDTPFSIVHDHIFTPLPTPSSQNPEVSEAVERVLLKALAKDRQDRYPNVDALVSGFTAAYRGEEIGETNLKPTVAVPEARTTPPPEVETVAEEQAEVEAERLPTPAVGKRQPQTAAEAGAVFYREAVPVLGEQPLKRRATWPWVVGGVLFTCIMLLLFLLLVRRSLAGGDNPFSASDGMGGDPTAVSGGFGWSIADAGDRVSESREEIEARNVLADAFLGTDVEPSMRTAFVEAGGVSWLSGSTP